MNALWKQLRKVISTRLILRLVQIVALAPMYALLRLSILNKRDWSLKIEKGLPEWRSLFYCLPLMLRNIGIRTNAEKQDYHGEQDRSVSI